MATVTASTNVKLFLPVNIAHPNTFHTARELVSHIGLASIAGIALSTGAALGIKVAEKIITVMGFLNPWQALIVSTITFLVSLYIFKGLQVTQAESKVEKVLENKLKAANAEIAAVRDSLAKAEVRANENDILKKHNNDLTAQVSDLTSKLAFERANNESITLKYDREVCENRSLQKEIIDKEKIILDLNSNPKTNYTEEYIT